jgi:calcium-dependent protein kinase
MATDSPDAATAEMIIGTFKKFDTNGDGKISRDELSTVMNSICEGESFTDTDIDKLLLESDANRDGFISYEEFVAWIMKDKEASSFQPLDKRGSFKVDFRKLLPQRFDVDVADRYALSKGLGEGGFGKVFVATDKSMNNRKVAIKMVQKEGNGQLTPEVEKEIGVMKDLDHPSICKLLATFEEGRKLFFVMELCEGGELFDRIIERGFVDTNITSQILLQVCEALAYAHGRSICHRDIKPENVVFLSKDPSDLRVKLIDWGLATNFNEGMKEAVGSMTYAAPEVITSQDKKVYSQACDLWSVGVLTYVMLCGKPPFWGTREQHLRAAKNERYPLKDPPWPKMAAEAKDFVKALLKAAPQERLPIDQCVQHAYLKTPPSEQASKEDVAGVLGNLKNFSNQSTFSRMCITAVARQLDHKDLGQVHSVFRSLDKDGNGVLSMEEITSGIASMGGDTSDLQKLLANVDMDGSGTIDYTEFCAAGLGAQKGTREDVMWAAFKTFDTDNSGFVSVENLKTILDSADVQDVWTADCCAQVGAEVVTKFDNDGDGKISFEEWQGVMSKCYESTRSEADSGVRPYAMLLKMNGLQAPA